MVAIIKKSGVSASSLNHGDLMGLDADDHLQYALLLGRATGQTLIGGTASGDDLILASTSDAVKGNIFFAEGSSTALAHITIEGDFHNTGGGIDSLVIGSGANVDGDEPRSTSIGVNATSLADDCVAIGYNSVAGSIASTVHRYCVAIGSGAVADVSSCVAIGYNADTAGKSGGTAIGASSVLTGNSSVAIGANASAGVFGVAIGEGTVNSGSGVSIGKGATGSFALGYNADSVGHGSAMAMGTSANATQLYTMAIGASSSATHGGSICIGQSATSTAIRQLVIGSDKLNAAHITDVYIGKGVVDVSVTDTTYHATGGEGTDIAGANIIFAGGKGTGNAAGGEVRFQTSTVGSTGTTLQTLATKMTIDVDGNVGIGTTTPAQELEVNGDILLGHATPTLYLGNDSDQYISGNAAGNYMTISTANAEKIRIDSSGNVGIGTTSPGAKLEVDAGAASVAVILRSSFGPALRFEDDGEAKYFDIHVAGSGPVMSFTHETLGTLMTLTPNNDKGLGIGTNNPRSKLDVAGGVSIGSTYAGTPSNSPTDGLAVEGNVGIGTKSPSEKLEVNGDIYLSSGVIKYDSNKTKGSGTVSLTSTSTSVSVTFDNAMDDTNYVIAIEVGYQTSFWITSKTASGFTINVGTSDATYNQDIYWSIRPY